MDAPAAGAGWTIVPWGGIIQMPEPDNHADFRYTDAMKEPPSKHTLTGQLTALAPEVLPEVTHDLVARMDDEYFTRFAPTDIARHLRLLARLTPDRPCEISVEKQDGDLSLTVVAYDYFSEFAAIAGLLSSHRLDIREGALYTFADSAEP